MMEKVISDRDNMLNSKAPGVNQVPTNIVRQNDMRRECYEAAVKSMADPRSKDKRQALINLCRDVGHSRAES